MRFAACDDEKIFRDELINAVYSCSNLHRLELVVDEFESGEELLKTTNTYDVIFLDYKMEGYDGLETARLLREKGIASTIIFLTSYPDVVFDTFEVTAFRFLKKPLDIDELNRALDGYFAQQRDNMPILLKMHGETISVMSNDIVYLEADNKKCYINLINDRLHFPRTMSKAEVLLPKNYFFKTHKAFIVNLYHVRKYDKEFVYFDSKDSVPISRNYLRTFKDVYMTYAKSRNS